MSAALMNRPNSDNRSRHRDGRFATEQRAEALDSIDLMGSNQAKNVCHLCPTCQQINRGGQTDEECAIVTGGPCVLSPQDCGCTDCGSGR